MGWKFLKVLKIQLKLDNRLKIYTMSKYISSLKWKFFLLQHEMSWDVQDFKTTMRNNISPWDFFFSLCRCKRFFGCAYTLKADKLNERSQNIFLWNQLSESLNYIDKWQMFLLFGYLVRTQPTFNRMYYLIQLHINLVNSDFASLETFSAVWVAEGKMSSLSNVTSIILFSLLVVLHAPNMKLIKEQDLSSKIKNIHFEMYNLPA